MRRRRDGSGLTARVSVFAVASVTLLSLLAIVPAGVIASGTQFGPYQVTSVGSDPEAVAIGDVTSDGIADIVLTTGYAGTPADFGLLVFAGLADGTLAAPVRYATAGTYPKRPETVDIGDVDGDGRPDVVVGLSGLGIQLFAQAADGSLGAPDFVPSADSHKLAVVDTSAGTAVAGIGWGTDTVTIFADTGAGLAAAGTYPARHDGWDDIESGDVSGDGRPDIVVMSGQGLVPNLSVLPALPDGTFGTAAEYAVGDNQLTRGIGIGEVTGDGRDDVVAAYGGNSPNGRLGIFAQTPTGALDAPPIPYQSYDIPGAVEVADVNGDAWSEAIVVHEGWLRIGVYRGQVGGQFAGEDLYPVPFSNGGNPHGLAVGDVTADGWPDIVIADDLHGLLILPNIGEATPPSPSPSFTFPPPTFPPPTPTPDPTPTPSPTPRPRPPPRPRRPRRPSRRRRPSRSRRARTWPPASASPGSPRPRRGRSRSPGTGSIARRGARRRRRWSPWATCSPSPTRRS